MPKALALHTDALIFSHSPTDQSDRDNLTSTPFDCFISFHFISVVGFVRGLIRRDAFPPASVVRAITGADARLARARCHYPHLHALPRRLSGKLDLWEKAAARPTAALRSERRSSASTWPARRIAACSMFWSGRDGGQVRWAL